MIAVVVLTFDIAPGLLEAAVASVAAAGDADLIVVVDNGTAATARIAAMQPPVECRIVRTGSNLGYAGGMNVGIDVALEAGATMIALLNDDARADPGWLTPLVAELETNPTVGAAQPMLVFDTEPLTVNSLGVQLGTDGAGTDIGYGQPLPTDTAPHDIAIFTGGAVLLSARYLADVGRFDARYFLYYEDVDLALRGGARGWRYRCAPASTVHHVGSASTAGGASTAYFRERNRLWVLLRHRNSGDVARGLWLSMRRVRHTPRAVHMKALAAGVAAAPRLLWARVRARFA